VHSNPDPAVRRFL